MKLSTILTFTAGLTVCIPAQNRPNLSELTYPSGIIIGLGAGMAQYTTKWKITNQNTVSEYPELLVPPVHVHNKYELAVFMENRSVAKMGPLHLDVRGEFRWGVSGSIDQDYLPANMPTTITDQGMNFTGGAHFKFALPFRLTPRVTWAPFAGVGLCFSYLQAKGSGLKSEYTHVNYLDRSYKIGWTEFAIYLPVSAGMNLDFKSFSITPEARYIGYGQASSDLQGTPEISPQSMQFWAGMITIGFHR